MSPAAIFNGDGVKILKDKLKFKTTGEIHWDAVNGCPAYDSDIPNVTNQIGQETHVRVYNPSGVTIPNGAVVYINGTDPDGTHPSIALAQANSYETSRVLGMVTAPILTLEHGIVTVRGIVNGLNTAAFSAGDAIYLDPVTAGAITKTRPNDGNYTIDIGSVCIVNATTGSVFIDVHLSVYTVETNQKTGWSTTYGNATISFVDGTLGATRTLTLTPTGTEFHFYQEGVKYSKTTDSFKIADTEGLHIIYYNLGTMSEIVAPTEAQIDSVIRNNVTVAWVNWDFVNRTANYVGRELHDMQFPSIVHAYNHFAYGARYLQGLGPNSIIADGNGSLDSHAQFGVDSGSIADEDIYLPTSTIASTVGLPIFYLAGTTAAPTLRKTTNAGFSFLTAGTGRVAYNLLTGGNWTLAEATNNNFVLVHVFCINENTIAKRVCAFVGQAQYTSVALAIAGASTEITSLRITGIVPKEIKSIATFVLETRDSYANSVNARIRTISTGVNYQDWRSVNNTGGSVAGGSTPTVFQDSTFEIFDDLDATKTFRFQAANITTGTTRTITVPDKNITIGEILPWITGTNYSNTATVYFTDLVLYKCLIAHTAGTFATDLAAGKWSILSRSEGGDFDFLATKLIADYVTYDDGATAIPVDGISGTPSFITVAASPSPITSQNNILNLRISKSATGSALGEGVSVSFSTRGLVDRAAMRICKLSILSSANYIDNAFGVYLFDVTNSRLIYPADQNVKASSFVSSQQFEFQLSPDSDSYRLCFHCQDSTVTSAYDLDCVVKFVESKQVSGSIITGWKDCVPTSNFTNATVTGKSRRVGENKEYDINVLFTGSPGAANFVLTLPSGDVIDTTKLPTAGTNQYLGIANLADQSVANYTGIIGYNDTTSVYLSYLVTTGSGTPIHSNNPVSQVTPAGAAWVATDYFVLRFSVPIVGLGATAILGQDAGQRPIICNSYKAANQTGIGPNGSFVKIAFDTASRDTVAGFIASKYTAQESGDYNIDSLLSFGGTNVLAGTYYACIYTDGVLSKYGEMRTPAAGVSFTIGVSDLVYLNKWQYVEIYLYGSGNNSSNTLIMSGGTPTVGGSYLNIFKLASPQQIAASEKINCKYSENAGQSLSSTGVIVVCPTREWDTHNIYNPSTGTITLPANGKYKIKTAAYILLSATADNQSIETAIKTGAVANAGTLKAISILELFSGQSNSTSEISTTIQGNMGDTFTWQMKSDAGVSRSIYTGAPYVWLEINKID